MTDEADVLSPDVKLTLTENIVLVSLSVRASHAECEVAGYVFQDHCSEAADLPVIGWSLTCPASIQ